MASYEESKVYQIRCEVLVRLRSVLKLLERANESDDENRDEKLISYLSGKRDALHDMLVTINSSVNMDWITLKERKPKERGVYEITFINEAGHSEHGMAPWEDDRFHIPYEVIAWREHLEPYSTDISIYQ